MTPRPAPSDPAGVLLVTRDRALSDHVRALADAAATSVTVQPSASGPAFRGSALVLVGLDTADDVPRGRSGVVLVARVDGNDVPEGVWKQALDLGAEQVAVLPEAEPWLLDRLIDAGGAITRAPVIAMIGGCGGAGASTMAVGLATVAARSGLRPVLIDADPFGGGIDLALGAEDVQGLRWPDLPFGRPGRLRPGALLGLLPDVGGIGVIACPRREPFDLGPAVAVAALDAAARDSDLVVLDLPRRVGPTEQGLLSGCSRVLLVVPAEVRATAAGAQVVTAIEAHTGDLRVVVRGPAPTGLEAEAVADALALPLQGELRPEPGLPAALDRGEAGALRPRGPLTLLCRRILAEMLAPS
ncbi:MAG TPA: septum site-determining protein Ssd [Kineosporiaceae bacterium]|nr:septum site-determining protein Ssd [Kineosporiaceae bacterium]